MTQHATPQSRPQSTPQRTSQRFTLTATATDLTVRDILAQARHWLQAQGVADELCGSVELALAEALNNIVEHAYAADARGAIRLVAILSPARLICVLSDHGRALPGLELPGGDRPAHTVARDDLPEGGFGWFLIRDLTDRIDYRRHAGWNHLTLDFGLIAP